MIIEAREKKASPEMKPPPDAPAENAKQNLPPEIPDKEIRGRRVLAVVRPDPYKQLPPMVLLLLNGKRYIVKHPGIRRAFDILGKAGRVKMLNGSATGEADLEGLMRTFIAECVFPANPDETRPNVDCVSFIADGFVWLPFIPSFLEYSAPYWHDESLVVDRIEEPDGARR